VLDGSQAQGSLDLEPAYIEIKGVQGLSTDGVVPIAEISEPYAIQYPDEEHEPIITVSP
jgi:hypothetical protein